MFEERQVRSAYTRKRVWSSSVPAEVAVLEQYGMRPPAQEQQLSSSATKPIFPAVRATPLPTQLCGSARAQSARGATKPSLQPTRPPSQSHSQRNFLILSSGTSERRPATSGDAARGGGSSTVLVSLADHEAFVREILSEELAAFVEKLQELHQQALDQIQQQQQQQQNKSNGRQSSPTETERQKFRVTVPKTEPPPRLRIPKHRRSTAAPPPENLQRPPIPPDSPLRRASKKKTSFSRQPSLPTPPASPVQHLQSPPLLNSPEKATKESPTEKKAPEISLTPPAAALRAKSPPPPFPASSSLAEQLDVMDNQKSGKLSSPIDARFSSSSYRMASSTSLLALRHNLPTFIARRDSTDSQRVSSQRKTSFSKILEPASPIRSPSSLALTPPKSEAEIALVNELKAKRDQLATTVERLATCINNFSKSRGSSTEMQQQQPGASASMSAALAAEVAAVQQQQQSSSTPSYSTLPGNDSATTPPKPIPLDEEAEFADISLKALLEKMKEEGKSITGRLQNRKLQGKTIQQRLGEVEKRLHGDDNAATHKLQIRRGNVEILESLYSDWEKPEDLVALLSCLEKIDELHNSLKQAKATLQTLSKSGSVMEKKAILKEKFGFRVGDDDDDAVEDDLKEGEKLRKQSIDELDEIDKPFFLDGGKHVRRRSKRGSISLFDTIAVATARLKHRRAVVPRSVAIQNTIEDELQIYKYSRLNAMLQKQRAIHSMAMAMQVAVANIHDFWTGAEVELTCPRCCNLLHMPMIIAPCGSSCCERCTLPSDDAATVDETAGMKPCGCTSHDGCIADDPMMELVAQFELVTHQSSPAEVAIQDLTLQLHSLLKALGLEGLGCDAGDSEERAVLLQTLAAQEGEVISDEEFKARKLKLMQAGSAR